MNIKQAKEIPIEAVLKAIQAEETKATPDRSEIWYKAPWRDEKTASLHVDTRKNVYYDHGEGMGGDAIKLVCRHGNKTTRQALHWLEKLTYNILPKNETSPPRAGKTAAQGIDKPSNRLLKEKTITNKTLCKYISDRGLSLDLVKEHCREVSFKTEQGRVLYGIGMQNDKKGWEVRAAVGNFKTVVGEKALTSIAAPGRGEIDTLHVFEGYTDFLTMEQMRGRPDGAAVLILNSASMAAQGIEKIKTAPRLKNVKQILCWFDNDDTGRKILMQFADELHELAEVGDMSANYQGYKDLNEYWTTDPDAKKNRAGMPAPAAMKLFNTSASTVIANPGKNKYENPKI